VSDREGVVNYVVFYWARTARTEKSATFAFRWPALGSKLPPVPTPEPGHLIWRLAITTFLNWLSESGPSILSDNALREYRVDETKLETSKRRYSLTSPMNTGERITIVSSAVAIARLLS
jgi:hypothetical protein